MVECKINQLEVFCCDLGCMEQGILHCYHSEEAMQWPVCLLGVYEKDLSRRWSLLSNDATWAHEITRGEYTEWEKQRVQINKYIKNTVLACDWCYTKNRAGSKDSYWWDSVGGIFMSGGNWDGSKEECRTEKVHPVQKKYQVQMQRVVK